MEVFVAGASGAVGRRLVPALIARGHAVIGTTRSPEGAEQIRRLGARPVVVDALDAGATMRAVTDARPDAIVRQLTALSRFKSPKALDQELGWALRLPSWREGFRRELADAASTTAPGDVRTAA